MVGHLALILIGLVLISAAALWGLTGLRADFTSALKGHEDLRHVYDVSTHLATARRAAALERPDPREILRELRLADSKLTIYSTGPLRDRLEPRLDAVQEKLVATIAAQGSPSDIAPDLDQLLVTVPNAVGEIRQTIKLRQDAFNARRRNTLITMAALAGGIAFAAVLLSIRQYRAVMHPLGNLSRGVSRLSQGNLSERVAESGPGEFAALAADFNRMAGQLDALYRDLEEKVARTSRELVRSERLASVGFLAAGVAHEINNPIGIIAGYAELSLDNLGKLPAEPALADAERSLRVIAEESFRCKSIVQKLLTLARGSDDAWRVVDLADLARSVVDTVGGLHHKWTQKLTVAGDDGPLPVHASETELKQVILNLVVNALESTDPAGGRVDLRLRRVKDQVELAVTDNGRGMTPETLQRIFEPFFTAKRGAHAPGTGLGLSIAHAIVRNHHGTLTAHSDGMDRGSTFVLSLPSAPEDRR